VPNVGYIKLAVPAKLMSTCNLLAEGYLTSVLCQ